MHMLRTSTLLGTAIALALAGGLAVAQTAPKAKTVARVDTTAKGDPALEAQLADARRDLDRAAKRVAELSRQLGRDDDARVRIVERRVGGRPVIGVLLAPDAQAGVRITGVTPDSGAAKAGLKAGDRIVSVGATQVLGSSGDLRVDNARKLLGSLEDGKAVRIGYVRDGKAATTTVTPRRDEDVFWVGGGPGDSMPRIRRIDVPGVAPDVREEVIRISPRKHCKGPDCGFPAFTEAFRWNGLNLASMDPQLGRYFGTERGVLVLSTGPELAGLQAGDVVLKIDGRTVTTPRDAMDALRGKPENALALVEYLRDRRVASTRVKLPKAMQFRVPVPPPAPPTPPVPPVRAPKAPPAPPAPPTPPSAAFDADGAPVTFERFAFRSDVPTPPEAPEAPEIVEDVELDIR